MYNSRCGYVSVCSTVPSTIPSNCTHGDIRLVGGSTDYEGNVEVCVSGVWGTICDSSWSSSDAQVACAQAGYLGQGSRNKSVLYR